MQVVLKLNQASWLALLYFFDKQCFSAAVGDCPGRMLSAKPNQEAYSKHSRLFE
jgi:hypothetical protein